MRTLSWSAVIVAGLLAGGSVPPVLEAQAPPLIYPPADASKDIDAALAAATRDGKYVLLDFGADWCPDCRVLGALFDDPGVAPVAAANFHVVHVDVGRRDKNHDLVAKYGATSDAWIPAVVVLDGRGRTVAATDDTLRLTRKTTTQQLLTVLRQWAPKKGLADLAAFTESGVRVVVRLEEDRSGESWLAALFTPLAADAHLYSKDLPPEGINGLGRPTRLSIAAATGLKPTGVLSADRPPIDDRIEALQTTLPVYPDGPVTLRLPIEITGDARAELSLGYMACSPSGCLRPVVDKRVVVQWGVGSSGVPAFQGSRVLERQKVNGPAAPR